MATCAGGGGNDEPGELDALRRRLEALELQNAELKIRLERAATSSRQLYEQAPIAYHSVDDEGRLLATNQEWLDLLGYQRDEVIGRPFGDFLSERSRRRFQVGFPHFKRAGIVNGAELELITKTGKAILVILDGKVEHGPEGRFDRTHCILHDVTEQRKSETDLRRLAMIVDQSGESIIITVASGYIEYVNPAFERITGYTRSEAIGENPRILKSDRHDQAFYAQMWQELNASGQWHGLFINCRKDGTHYHKQTSISCLRDDRGQITGYVAIGRDATKEVELEAQLRHAQKMEAVGQLAGGVAHDFNNLLLAIFGYTDLLLADLEQDDPRRDDVAQIRITAERAANLTRQLLAFSRRQVIAPVPLDVNQVVADVIKMLRRLIGEHVELDVRLGPKIGLVNCDPGQLEQVLINLCVNARDAMPDGGRITIRTEATGTEDPADRWVQLTVGDTGHGMDNQTLSRIFEPFFTTKEVGRGTGLGLSTIYGIVQQHGGSLDVQSETGKGTTFRIALRVDPSAAPAEVTLADEPGPGGHETILLAEDDDVARRTTTRILTAAGYSVVAATNGERAVELFRSFGEGIDLLLADVVMPKMSGVALRERVLEFSPGARVLLTTGYAEQADDRSVGLPLLQKPYDARTLLRRVRQMLDADGAR